MLLPVARLHSAVKCALKCHIISQSLPFLFLHLHHVPLIPFASVSHAMCDLCSLSLRHLLCFP